MDRAAPELNARPVSAAARELGISPETLRLWIRSGCPALPGGPGRGKGSRVNVAAVRVWRDRKASSSEGQLRAIASVALDFYRRGMEPDVPGQRILGISNARAAALLCFFLEHLAERIFRAELNTPESKLLVALARETVTL